MRRTHKHHKRRFDRPEDVTSKPRDTGAMGCLLAAILVVTGLLFILFVPGQHSLYGGGFALLSAAGIVLRDLISRFDDES